MESFTDDLIGRGLKNRFDNIDSHLKSLRKMVARGNTTKNNPAFEDSIKEINKWFTEIINGMNYQYEICSKAFD
jgi:hypothetical protein